MITENFCKWREPGFNDDVWEASCGGAYCFDEDGPEENRYKFCPSCGRKIEIVKYKEEECEDEENK